MSAYQGGKNSSGKETLSKKEFAEWEKAHREKMGGQKSAELKTEEKVKKCLALAVRGALILCVGLAGIFMWPFLFTADSPSGPPHLLIIIPFSIVSLIGVIVIAIAGITFLTTKENRR